jgi:ribosomal protein S18 acetylase RimI-like enzyme
VLVRELNAADKKQAIALWREAGLTRSWNDPGRDFDRALDGATSAVLGGIDRDHLVGTVMVGHDGHRGWAYYLAASRASRRSGVGRRMMDEAERWLRARGAVKLNLMVRHSNSGVLEFYEQLGYVDAGVTVLARWLSDAPDA